MGTRVAPTFANIYMDSFEQQHVYIYRPKPCLWLRFIDDVLLIWDHGMDELHKFLTYLNDRHPNIKFSREVSHREVSFLDINISKDNSGKLRTDLFSKTTDANNYLHYTSAHTTSCKDGILYSQFLRIKLICSEETDFLKRCVEKALHMKRRGYPIQLLIDSFSSTCSVNRDDLLAKKSPIQEPSVLPLIGVTSFHPRCRAFSKCIRENWPILGRSTTTEALYNSRLIVAYRIPENLGDLLIRAKLLPQKREAGRYTYPHKSPRCTTVRCPHCLRLDRTGRITSHTMGRSYVTMKNVTCKSSNLIYCLSCKRCGEQYVGQTQQTFMKRVYAHIYSINTNGDTSVAIVPERELTGMELV